MNENNFPSCGSDYFNGPPAPVIDHNGRIIGQTLCTQHKDADAPVIWFRPLHAGKWGHWREIDTPATNAAPVADERAALRQAVTLLLQVHPLLGPCDHELRDRIGAFLGKGGDA